ncbi:hypothetical protein SO802_031269 [Lithocarpus litseifolius]|uniref:Uncharacterized protein n=1 Tax=Lithocarpus litseifolius TaxID=425828 RepID=A0AAW2BL67_9ROSI
MLPGQFTNLSFLHMVTEVLEYALHAKGILIFYLAFGVIASLQLVTVIQIFFFVESTKFFSFFFFLQINMSILNCQIARSTNSLAQSVLRIFLTEGGFKWCAEAMTISFDQIRQ